MIVRDFHAVRVSLPPHEAGAVLVVDADAVLTFPASPQLLQPVAGRRREVLRRQRGIQNVELPQRRAIEPRRQTPALAGCPKLLGIRIPKPGDHALSYRVAF